MLKIMDALLKVKEEEMPEDVWEFANACIPYVDVEVLFDFDQILKSLLSGETCVFIDGYRACIVIDCRTSCYENAGGWRKFQNGCGTLLHGRQGRQGTVEKCT